jgi:predicted sulfurtransferase
MLLHNPFGRPQLVARLNAEKFVRRTLSFYRYVNINDPQEFRDQMYMARDKLQCYGRVDIAREGINAQMSVPEHQVEALNFVFDDRLGERITEDIISYCHQYGKSCDTYVNCAYDPCHKFVIQCDECAEKYSGCCSDECYYQFAQQSGAKELGRDEAKVEIKI